MSSHVQDLELWCALAGIAEHFGAVCKWCDDMGVHFLDELVEHVDDLLQELPLAAEQAAAVAAGARDALLRAHPPAAVAKTSGRAASGHGMQSLRALSAAPGGDMNMMPSGSSAGAGGSISRTFTFPAGVKMAQAAQRLRALGGSPSTKLQRHTEDEVTVHGSDSPPSPSLVRKATVSVFGPVSAVFCSQQVAEGDIEVSCMSQKNAFKPPERKDGCETPTTKLARDERTSSRRDFGRMDTVGLEVCDRPSRREALLSQVHEDGVRPVNLDAGQTGQVYALEVGGEKIAVFKPAPGEGFQRRGLETGEGYIREEAVYLVDRICDSRAGVPVTSRASIQINGETLEGSVQKFMGDVLGFIEEFGMPRDAARAEEFVTQEEAEALALLDMRVFNMDRHSGNLLLLRREKPHGLGPIDHGCCLPSWWLLGEAIFDAWEGWVQFKSPPREATRLLAATAHQQMARTVSLVRGLGLREECILTLQLCTLLMKVAIAELAVPVGLVVRLILRKEEDIGGHLHPVRLSWLEKQVLAAGGRAGAICRLGKDDRGYETIEVDNSGQGLDAMVFLAELESAFREDVLEATEWTEPPPPLPALEALLAGPAPPEAAAAEAACRKAWGPAKRW